MDVICAMMIIDYLEDKMENYSVTAVWTFQNHETVLAETEYSPNVIFQYSAKNETYRYSSSRHQFLPKW